MKLITQRFRSKLSGPYVIYFASGLNLRNPNQFAGRTITTEDNPLSYTKLRLSCALVALVAGARAAPAATIYAVNTSNALLRFDSAAPGTTTSVGVSGLQPGETLEGIDFRPANLMLYGLGSTSRIYVINPATGAATPVGAPGAFVLAGTDFGFDFNPVPDRIRVTSNADQNLRLNPGTGALAATDGTLAYAALDINAGANPNIVASAYTNSFAGATSTTLYDIDSNLDILVTQSPPNAGTLNTVGSLGINIGSMAGFDIQPLSGVAFAALQTPGSFSSLYTINLNTGAATLVGAIGSSETIRGLAVVSDVPEPGSLALLSLGVAGLAFRRWRRR
jgi:hypothetical protein